jgi:hypothetical protein
MAKRKPVKPRVPRTRNMNTQTEAMFFSGIRSALRRHFRYWKPIQYAKKRARRLSGSKAKGEKWEYQCHICSLWHFKVEVDHIIPVGSLRSLDDLAGFVERLTEEDVDKYRVLCKECHQEITNQERQRKKNDE